MNNTNKPRWGGTIGGIDDYWKGYHDGVVEWEQAIKKIFEGGEK